MDFDLQSAAIILNYWCLPGGRVEPGKDERKRAQRELLEETGYSSNSPVFLHSQIYKVATNLGGFKL